jgi:hypothetical protein
LNSKPTGMMRSSLHIRGFSFTAFIIACLGKAIDEHKAVQAFRKGSKRLILFEEVLAAYDSFPPCCYWKNGEEIVTALIHL